MDQRARIIIGGLGALAVILAVALVAVIATNGGGGTAMHGGVGGSAPMGMMQAMGNMDSDAMLAHMREVLGEDGDQHMLQHFRDHLSGGPMTGDTAIDGMMHQMMDGMMQQMPDDSGHMMPRATVTPTPAGAGTLQGR